MAGWFANGAGKDENPCHSSFRHFACQGREVLLVARPKSGIRRLVEGFAPGHQNDPELGIVYHSVT